MPSISLHLETLAKKHSLRKTKYNCKNILGMGLKQILFTCAYWNIFPTSQLSVSTATEEKQCLLEKIKENVHFLLSYKIHKT